MLLTLIVFLPLLAGLALWALPEKQARMVALAAMVLDLVLVLAAAFFSGYDWSGTFAGTGLLLGSTIETTFQHRVHAPWPGLDQFGISFTLGADNLSMIMIVLTGFLGVIGVLCSWTAIQKREREFYMFLLMLQTGIMGTFLALDLFLFYIFWELMLVPLYFMIGIWGSKNRIYATMKFVIYTLVGSLLMLIGMIWMYYNNGEIVNGVMEYTRTYSYELMLQTQSGKGSLASFHSATWPFLALFLAFAIKVPLFPFHTWLPDAHTEAPTAGSVILAGVLLKTGGYGMLRFCLPLFPEAAISFSVLISWLAVIAIIYGAMTAIVQTDIKRLVAYSSVSHMGFVVLGIFSLNEQGMTGAILQMVNHGISTSGLFLAVGMLYERRHTRLMSEFGGLAKTLPIYAALTMVMVLSSVGLPGLNGFLGEFNVLLGSMKHMGVLIEAQDQSSFAASVGMTSYTWLVAALASTGVILGAVYLLIMYQRTFFGKLDEKKNGALKDLEPREWGQLAFLSVAALVIGLFPQPLFRAIAPASEKVLEPLANAIETRLPMKDGEIYVAHKHTHSHSHGHSHDHHHDHDHDHDHEH